MCTHNSNRLLLLISLTIMFIFSCAKNPELPSVSASKETLPIAVTRNTSPIENYTHNFREAVRQYWAFSSPLDEPMAYTVDIEISPGGEITSYKLTKSSGNKYFDNSALNAIVRTQKSGVRLPPPEPLPKGITIIFSLPKSIKR